MVPSSGDKKVTAKRKMHPNSLANLKPILWKPGESGNPKGSSLTQRLQDAMEKPLVEPGAGAAAGDRLVHATLQGAIDLQPTPFRETWDRTEGKVIEKHALITDVNVKFTIGEGFEKIDDNQD